MSPWGWWREKKRRRCDTRSISSKAWSTRPKRQSTFWRLLTSRRTSTASQSLPQQHGAFLHYAVYFALAHEIGHHVLDIFHDATKSAEELRLGEKRVDHWAASMMAKAQFPAPGIGLFVLGAYEVSLLGSDAAYRERRPQTHDLAGIRAGYTFCTPKALAEANEAFIAAGLPSPSGPFATACRKLQGFSKAVSIGLDHEALRKRARNKDRRALYQLGVLTSRDDPERGFIYYYLGARHAEMKSLYATASALFYGDGIKKNVPHSIIWFGLGAATGHRFTQATYRKLTRAELRKKKPELQIGFCAAEKARAYLRGLIPAARRGCNKFCKRRPPGEDNFCVRKRCVESVVKRDALIRVLRRKDISFDELVQACQ